MQTWLRISVLTVGILEGTTLNLSRHEVLRSLELVCEWHQLPEHRTSMLELAATVLGSLPPSCIFLRVKVGLYGYYWPAEPNEDMEVTEEEARQRRLVRQAQSVDWGYWMTLFQRALVLERVEMVIVPTGDVDKVESELMCYLREVWRRYGNSG